MPKNWPLFPAVSQKNQIFLWAAALLGAGSASPAVAHPSYSMFDMNVTYEVTAIVDRFDFTNPHSWLHVRLIDAEDEQRILSLEMDGVPDLVRKGIRNNTISPGQTLNLIYNPMRGDRPGGLWRGHVDEAGAAFGEYKDLAEGEQ